MKSNLKAQWMMDAFSDHYSLHMLSKIWTTEVKALPSVMNVHVCCSIYMAT